MWGAQGRYPDLGDMVDGVRAAGGERIEINYMPTRAQLAQLLARPDLVVSSIHNICPRPTDAHGARIPDPDLAAEDADERAHAVALAQATLDLAARVGAGAVVTHAGNLVVEPEYQARLEQMYRDGLSDTDEYGTLKEWLVWRRREIGWPATGRLAESLSVLVPYAEATGVRLGLEIPQDYWNLLTIDELGEALRFAPSPLLGYWHDTGHAERQANLGFTPHRDWLDRHGDRLIGFHLHDCDGLRDHLIPGRGRIDWRMVVSYLRTDTVPSCEFDYYEEVADIRAGLGFLRAAGFENGEGA